MGVAAEQPGMGARQAGWFDVGEQLEALARPRLVGTEGAAQVTEHIRATLARSGYDVRSLGFRFNPWPGRLGVSLLGTLHLLASLWAGSLLVAGSGRGALGVLLAALLLAGGAATVGRRLLDRAPRALHDGTNLLALPRGRPKYLIVAHRDSKSQPVPLALRGPAIAAALLTWACLLVLAVVALARPVAPALAAAVAFAGAAAGLVLALCRVGNNSPGALDNASGVATLLGIAQEQHQAGDVALLVTDAEELGLAGSRAMARSGLPAVSGAINLDGIDDAGPFYLMERFGWPRTGGRAPVLVTALLRAGDDLKLDVRRRDTPFGVMLDHMPLVSAGTPALTIMRGSASSLRRVHRPGDDLASLRGQGIAPAIRLVGRALDGLRAQELPGPLPEPE